MKAVTQEEPKTAAQKEPQLATPTSMKVAMKATKKGATRKDDIDYIVKDIMTYKLGLERSQLADSAHLQDDLGVDSLDILELFAEIEKQFQIRIPDEEAEKLTTVARVLQCVRQKML
jgi:acyl carrier protein